MFARAGSRPAVARGTAGDRAAARLRRCYATVGVVTLLIAIVAFYVYLFVGVRGFLSSDGKLQKSIKTTLRDGLEAIDQRIHHRSQSSCDAAVEDALVATDPDKYLDTIGDHPPPIEKSHYAQVHGIEPFERGDMKPWQLHVIPTDDWYERAKRATDRCDLELTKETPGAEKGLADEVIWVSGLFDLNRKDLTDFKRPLTEYYNRFNRILDRGFKMIIFIPPAFEEHLHIDRSKHFVIHMNASSLTTYFPYWDRLQAIRTSKLWNVQAEITGWLSKSPQARLPEYNPLVMSKLFLLRDAARLNPWGARFHLWVDAGHLCATEQNPTRAGTSMYREHMAKGMFVTHWPYGTTTEVHGLNDKAMHLYLAQQDDPLLIVRGGIFGGQLPHIECVTKAYVIALHQTLADGYVGTEECIWAMIHKRLPHLFNSFDNNSLGNHGDNCASFVKELMVEKDIAAGKAEVFKAPPVPDHPSWKTGLAAGATASKPGSIRILKQVRALREHGAFAASIPE